MYVCMRNVERQGVKGAVFQRKSDKSMAMSKNSLSLSLHTKSLGKKEVQKQASRKQGRHREKPDMETLPKTVRHSFEAGA